MSEERQIPNGGLVVKGADRFAVDLVASGIRVLEFWAGLAPLVFVVWQLGAYYVHNEIRDQNRLQDEHIEARFVSREELDRRLALWDERMKTSAETLKDIREEQKTIRSLLERKR